MTEGTIRHWGRDIAVTRVTTAVIGSGCAGLNAADCLWDLGHRDLVLMTEGMQCGTSRNTGSDKQTYYKLSLAGDDGDSVGALAADLWQQGVHGDTALAEAASSARCFYKLVALGVPFPENEYGEFAGYQTDHDARRRATSAGPLTSRYMTEALERSVRAKGVPLLDHCLAVRILTENGQVTGVLCDDHSIGGLRLVLCAHVVLCTGGPAHIYADSVYPAGHTGMGALALQAGAAMANLHHWQYGLASVQFRWNVSGSYQQVLPRYVSVDAEGQQREFLADTLGVQQALALTFRKGYEWPFDTRKLPGSSLVDLLVLRETRAGRRVFLDFTRNPTGLDAGSAALDDVSRDYLARCGATQSTPIARLEHMNEPAVALFFNHGIDLTRELLEVKVCAQHHNGGVAVDAHWQSSLAGLYVAGEAAGTFGAYRPGGSALNATQVGSLRAAQHIAASRRAAPDLADAPALLGAAPELLRCDIPATRAWAQRVMSDIGALLRDPAALQAHQDKLCKLLAASTPLAEDEAPGWAAWKLGDLLTTQLAVCAAMLAAAPQGSSGSGAIVDAASPPMHPALDFGIRPQANTGDVLITRMDGQVCASHWEPRRPLPQRELWFENVWRQYRARQSAKGAQP